MNQDTKDRQNISDKEIAVQAYYLWEKAGRPPGRDMEYWLKAKEQLARNAVASSAPAQRTLEPISSADNDDRQARKKMRNDIRPKQPAYV